MPYLLNGQTLTPGAPFEVGDVRYSGAELTLWPREELEALGLAWQEPTPPVPDLAAEALALLQASDATVLRCYERGVPVPPEWVAYRDDLRMVVSGTWTHIPDRPPYPDAT